ncbi:ribosome biogenesis factor YjgA [Reinekea blandensis]|uniref:Dual-action ribosomal maturation protein DarP n=1 Tax=Reinekea blandensis MED297 TaxID=314283 RepID=A4BC72_9GAMM|nr:ribosome biogenesis factor YjgA [Reinekea blandensis]EAR10138.1 hypothetical protein MED297_12982 [Reinekea sp. MED297] [Reinekea blandensis MED297]
MKELNDPIDEDDIEWVSKSEMKREMLRLQSIGEQLINLKASDLAAFPLSDAMLDAIEESRRIKSNEATRRHLQYIGKLMRSEPVEQIQSQLDLLDPSSEASQRILNQAEVWRERLLREDTAEADWFDAYPETDRQPFRSLVRAARKEQPDDPDAPVRGGKNSKKLLKWIKEQLIG